VIPSAGQTPYGFDFTDGGALIVTEAFGGDNGKAQLRRTRSRRRAS
jgi:hypothetical protein